ncbi:peptidase M14 [Pedobacter sp. HMF7647]|uniref:Peptidase M14 n=1 Tax=Hufsiella arboris TaxID=2695275 RepID=A0A7K1YDD0_9SPHI|nr:M14 family zinc carboxypeptidase [Hufsiella arboris]MXV52371.1 peptidase M14 [Hufsiella arboris]
MPHKLKPIIDNYESDFLNTSFGSNYIQFSQFEAEIKKLWENPLFKIGEVGSSFLQRPIYSIQAGSGSKSVMLWSQMHGDEPTATMALFDLLNFFSADDEFNKVRHLILNNCTFYILPFLNPDGAELNTRRNAQGIDINRDYLAQQSPEGRILRLFHENIKPDFSFNLHDQSIQWSAGKSGNPATISLLAPPYDDACSVNDTRLKAMQLATNINDVLQTYIPKYIGKWFDEFEPRAFGDNCQAAGSSTLLVESGGYKDDFDRQFVRKIVFIAMLTGVYSIAGADFGEPDVSSYEQLPVNEKRHFSILLKNCRINNAVIDIGLVAERIISNSAISYVYRIEDMGDLSGFFGYEEYDISALNIVTETPLAIEQPANFIIKDSENEILSFNNGRITAKKI